VELPKPVFQTDDDQVILEVPALREEVSRDDLEVLEGDPKVRVLEEFAYLMAKESLLEVAVDFYHPLFRFISQPCFGRDPCAAWFDRSAY